MGRNGVEKVTDMASTDTGPGWLESPRALIMR